MKKSILVLLLSLFYLIAYTQGIEVQKRSVRWLEKNVQPVEVGQKDFSFLDEYIKDKRIVVLGEQLHGVKEFEVVRTDIIEYLYQKHGFDVLLVESDMENIHYANFYKENLTVEEILKTFWGVWYSEEMKPLMAFIKANPTLQLAGFDSQFGLLSADYSVINNEYDSTFSTITKMASSSRMDENISLNRFKTISDSLIMLYQNALNRLPKDDNFDWSARIIQNKIEVLQRQKPNPLTQLDAFAYYRDSLMADNMEWLIQEKYPNRKIIIWGATVHVASCSDCTSLPEMYFSGKKLFENKAIRDSTYILITSLFEGTSSMSNYKFDRPPYSYDGIEKLFNEIEYPSFFVDISTPKIKKNNEWINQSIKMFPTNGYSMTGIQRRRPFSYHTLVPRHCFDGIIYFKKVTASTLLRRN